MSLTDALRRNWSIQIEPGLIVAERDIPGRRVTNQFTQPVRSGSYEESLEAVLGELERFDKESV